MLPSGRHIAVDPAPLRDLLSDPASPFNAYKIMAIRAVECDRLRSIDRRASDVIELASLSCPDERAA